MDILVIELALVMAAEAEVGNFVFKQLGKVRNMRIVAHCTLALCNRRMLVFF